MQLPITPRHVFEIYNLNYRLAEFIKLAFHEKSGEAEVALSRLTAFVALGSMHQLDGLGRINGYTFKSRKVVITERPERPEPPAADLAYEHYVQFITSHHLSAVSAAPPVDVDNLTKERCAAIRQLYEVPARLDLNIDTEDPVAVAWQTARRNSTRTYQRVGALFFLASKVPVNGLSRIERRAVELDNEKILNQLWERASQFETAELKFAMLLGGKYLTESRQKFAEQSFGAGVSIVQYLQVDGKFPMRYSEEQVTNFRSKIMEYSLKT